MTLKSPQKLFFLGLKFWQQLHGIAALLSIILLFSIIVTLLCYYINRYIDYQNLTLPLTHPSLISTPNALDVSNVLASPSYLDDTLSTSNTFDEIVLVILPNEKHVNLACNKPIH